MALAVGAGRFLLDRESNALFAAARITLLRFQMQNDSLRYAVYTTPGFYLFIAHNGTVNPVTILESFCFDSRILQQSLPNLFMTKRILNELAGPELKYNEISDNILLQTFND